MKLPRKKFWSFSFLLVQAGMLFSWKWSGVEERKWALDLGIISV